MVLILRRACKISRLLLLYKHFCTNYLACLQDCQWETIHSVVYFCFSSAVEQEYYFVSFALLTTTLRYLIKITVRKNYLCCWLKNWIPIDQNIHQIWRFGLTGNLINLVLNLVSMFLSLLWFSFLSRLLESGNLEKKKNIALLNDMLYSDILCALA